MDNRMRENEIPQGHETVEMLTEHFRMDPELERGLVDLESRIDPDVEDQILAEYRTFLDGNWPDPVFLPTRRKAAASGFTWPDVRVNAALNDFNQMAFQQFGACSRTLENGIGPLAIRSNYGVCISSAWFGCTVRLMDDDYNCLPTSLPMGGRHRIDDCVAAGVPDVTTGYGARVFGMGRLFRTLMEPYPRIRRYVHVYHPDFQSPIDTCELAWGSDVLLALYENPDQVHRFLDLVTNTYIDAVRKWSAIHPFSPDMNAHWNLLHKGCIMLRTDSGMNLSPAMYDEFIRPYEQRCLDACGGGAIHFCGRGDHFIASMTGLRGLTAIHISQPALNNMEIIYRNTVDRGITLLNLRLATAMEALAAGRDLHHRVLGTA